jgi:hypothetical protein
MDDREANDHLKADWKLLKKARTHLKFPLKPTPNSHRPRELGVKDKDFVAVRTVGIRRVILENVLCRVNPS